MLRSAVMTLAFLAIVCWQLFLPGYIGLANNGDFSKVAGRLCLGGTDQGRDNFVYFVPLYGAGRDECWDSGIPTVEVSLARFAFAVSSSVRGTALFDIRWLGAVHALGLALGFWLWLRWIEPLETAPWSLNALAALPLFSDAGVISYANTFYTDAPALAGAAIMIPAGLLLWRSPSLGWVAAFAWDSLLFVTSKSQHALLAMIPAALLIVTAIRVSQPALRFTSAVLALSVLAGSAAVMATTP